MDHHTAGMAERGRQSGNALVGALLVLLVLTAVGTAYVALSRTETQIAGHERRHVQSMFNAEAGVGEALARMSNSQDTTAYFGEDLNAGPATPGWGRYVVMAGGNSAGDPERGLVEADSLDNDGDGQIDEDGESYPEVTTSQTGSDQVRYPWVRVSYRLTPARQVVLFGDHDADPSTAPVPNLSRGLPILRVASQGDQGTARRRVEVEAVKMPFNAPRAAVYAESDDFKFNGTQFLISGKDWDPATGVPVVGAAEVPGIETTENPATIAGELHANQINNVEGVGTEPAVTSAAYDYDLEGMVDSYKEMADIVHPGGTIANGSLPAWGGIDEYHIVHVTDDLHISGNAVGGGLLLLEGDLTVSGSFTWYGMIINLGTITFTGGGGDIHIYGSVLTTGGLGTNVVGGNADILYSSLALSKLASFSPYKVSAWTELP